MADASVIDYKGCYSVDDGDVYGPSDLLDNEKEDFTKAREAGALEDGKLYLRVAGNFSVFTEGEGENEPEALNATPVWSDNEEDPQVVIYEITGPVVVAEDEPEGEEGDAEKPEAVEGAEPETTEGEVDEDEEAPTLRLRIVNDEIVAEEEEEEEEEEEDEPGAGGEDAKGE